MRLLLRVLQPNGASILDSHTVQWVVLLAASAVLFFANAQHALLKGDPLLYTSQARLIADSGEYATLRFGQELNHHGPLLFWLTRYKNFWPHSICGYIVLAAIWNWLRFFNRMARKFFLWKEYRLVCRPGAGDLLYLFAEYYDSANGFRPYIRNLARHGRLFSWGKVVGAAAVLFWNS